MKEKPNYYAIIPATVRYDTRLKANEKLLYGEITALAEKTGECWASNSYFANLYSVDPSAISKWIKNLNDCNYIKTDCIYKNNSKEIERRVIKMVLPNIKRGIDKSTRGVLTNGVEGYCQKDKDNTTSTNTTSINNIKEIYKENKIEYNEIVDYLNLKTNSSYKSTTPKTRELIKARYNEGFTLDDFKQVIDNKVNAWGSDEKMVTYLRPETLFSNKFEGYLNEKVALKKLDAIDRAYLKMKESGEIE